jgi:hypothetical protein
LDEVVLSKSRRSTASVAMVGSPSRPLPSSSLPTVTGAIESPSNLDASSTMLNHLARPVPTSPPASGNHIKRRRKAGMTWELSKHPSGLTHQNSLDNRAGASSGPTFDNYPPCDNVGNTLLSCFPLSNTTISQSMWSKFIWNANYPTFVENGNVDISLYQADSGEEVQSWKAVTNAQGSVEIRPEENWWRDQDRAEEIQMGETETYSYYFVVVPAGQTLNGGEPHQSTFQAVQTAPLAVALASISSASVASVSSALGAAAGSSAGTTSTGDGQGGRRTDGTLQNGASNNPAFPKWVRVSTDVSLSAQRLTIHQSTFRGHRR